MIHRIAVTCLLALTVAASAQPAKDPFAALQFRNVGPAAGGRVCRACGVPGDPLTYYAATAAGGVWKSADGGLSWKCVTDDQPTHTFGSIAVAPSDPNVVYAGSGEANIRGNVAAGNGIYKSTDAGKTWTHVWKNLGQIGTMAVHPTNCDVAYAAVLGSPFGPGEARGVYRTTDGGATWDRVLFHDADTGASDVALDPNNPRIIFAGLWQTRRKPWEMTSGGPGSGLYVSRDGGDTWTQLKPGENGLPEGVWGKIGVAVAPSDSNRVYAFIEADDGGLFRSDDGGDTWNHVNSSRPIRQRAWYYGTVHVAPASADIVYLPNVPLLKSIDGGKTFQSVRGTHHSDHHDIWIDPKNPKRMIEANDGGVDISHDGGKTWFAPPLPISQFYHVSCDNSVPYRVLGNMQDLGTASGPSNSLCGRGIRLADWHTVGGGETGFAVADPSDPNIVYSGEYGGYLSRYDHRTRQARNISAWPINPSGITPAEMKYRFQWTAPVVVSVHDPKTVYHAANVVFRTTDGGQSWDKISGDLTRDDKSKQKWSGGPITGDNTGVEIYGTVFALSESPKEKGLLWAGSDDGLIHVSRDGGATWVNVTANVPDFPDWATVRCVEPSPHAAGTAFLVAEAHRLNDFKPYIWKTDDFGKTWVSLTANLPKDVYLHVVREDPKRKGLLFAGTERGIHYSLNGGKAWKPLQCGLPTVAVHDLVVKNDDLVAGTMGRSVWILDDINPLRKLTAAARQKPAVLLPPSSAVRWRYDYGFSHTGTAAGDNPPDGAVIDFHLAKKPAKPVKVEITDAADRLLAAFVGKPKKAKTDTKDEDDEDHNPYRPALSDEPGLQRLVWDLTADGAEPIAGAAVDMGSPGRGMMVPPGEYTVKFTVDGQTQSAKLAVKPDPRGGGDVKARFELATKCRDDLGKLANAVKQIRSVKLQLTGRNQLLAGDEKAGKLRDASESLLKALDEIERKFHNAKAKIAYDIFALPGGARLHSQYAWLYETLKDADGPPTQGMRDVYADLVAELAKLLAEWDGLQAGAVKALNDQAKALDVPTVLVPKAKTNPR